MLNKSALAEDFYASLLVWPMTNGMKRQTLAVALEECSGFEQYRKLTRRDAFLKTMDAIVPWVALCAVVEPYYSKAGNGRHL